MSTVQDFLSVKNKTVQIMYSSARMSWADSKSTLKIVRPTHKMSDTLGIGFIYIAIRENSTGAL